MRGIDSFITGKRENLVGLERMEFLEGDLADASVCARACEGVEIVFHEAALASVPRSVADPVGTNVNCVDATLNLLVAAKAAGVRRLVYAGSSSAYGDTPTLPKREDMLPCRFLLMRWQSWPGEHYMTTFARVYGIETVTLRYFNVFGPYQDPSSHYSGVLAIFCRKMLAGEAPTIYGDGEQSRDFTYIANVVHANLLAAAAPAEKVSGPDDECGNRYADYAQRDIFDFEGSDGLFGNADLRGIARWGHPRFAGRYRPGKGTDRL